MAENEKTVDTPENEEVVAEEVNKEETVAEDKKTTEK